MRQARPIERPRRGEIDGAADAAFEIDGIGGLEHVRARDDFRRQHIERELAAVAVGREDAVVQCDDAELGAEAAHVDVLAFTAAVRCSVMPVM